MEIQAINFKGRQRLWLEVISLPAVSGLDRESLNRILQTTGGYIGRESTSGVLSGVQISISPESSHPSQTYRLFRFIEIVDILTGVY